MFFRLLAALFLVALLGGCVGTPHPMRMPPDDPGAARLIVGMYTSPGGDARPRSASFDVHHASSAEPMSLGYFRGESTNRYHSIAVRPGEYEIRNVQISLVGNHHIRARQPFAVRFKVEPGKAYYLGDFRILCKKSPNFGSHPACGLFLNTLDAEQEAGVRERFPGIGELQQADLQNLDSAYPIVRVELAAMIRRLQELGALPKSAPAQPEPAATP